MGNYIICLRGELGAKHEAIQDTRERKRALWGQTKKGISVSKRSTGYKKWNNNARWVYDHKQKESYSPCLPSGTPDEPLEGALYSDALQAFSHWTYEHSKEAILIADLQGKCRKDQVFEGSHGPVFTLTDPVIHGRKPEGTKQQSNGRTDLGKRGIANFF